MKVKQVKGWYCVECETFHREKPEEETVWRCQEVNEDGYTTEEPEREIGVICTSCSYIAVRGDDPYPEYDTYYHCGECESVYSDRDEASACCKD